VRTHAHTHTRSHQLPLGLGQGNCPGCSGAHDGWLRVAREYAHLRALRRAITELFFHMNGGPLETRYKSVRRRLGTAKDADADNNGTISEKEVRIWRPASAAPMRLFVLFVFRCITSADHGVAGSGCWFGCVGVRAFAAGARCGDPLGPALAPERRADPRADGDLRHRTIQGRKEQIPIQQHQRGCREAAAERRRHHSHLQPGAVARMRAHDTQHPQATLHAFRRTMERSP
jgi:hypothetical protein